jgi:hypothetical protein
MIPKKGVDKKAGELVKKEMIPKKGVDKKGVDKQPCYLSKILFHWYWTQFDMPIVMLNHTTNLLGRGNSFGLCSSHAAIQNETKGGRTCGITMKWAIAPDLQLVFSSLLFVPKKGSHFIVMNKPLRAGRVLAGV